MDDEKKKDDDDYEIEISDSEEEEEEEEPEIFIPWSQRFLKSLGTHPSQGDLLLYRHVKRREEKIKRLELLRVYSETSSDTKSNGSEEREKILEELMQADIEEVRSGKFAEKLKAKEDEIDDESLHGMEGYYNQHQGNILYNAMYKDMFRYMPDKKPMKLGHYIQDFDEESMNIMLELGANDLDFSEAEEKAFNSKRQDIRECFYRNKQIKPKKDWCGACWNALFNVLAKRYPEDKDHLIISISDDEVLPLTIDGDLACPFWIRWEERDETMIPTGTKWRLWASAAHHYPAYLKDLPKFSNEICMHTKFRSSVMPKDLKRLRVVISPITYYERCADYTDFKMGEFGLALVLIDSCGRKWTGSLEQETLRTCGWTKTQALHAIVRKAGYKGYVDERVWTSKNGFSFTLFRFVSYTSVALTYNEYRKWRKKYLRSQSALNEKIDLPVHTDLKKENDTNKIDSREKQQNEREQEFRFEVKNE